MILTTLGQTNVAATGLTTFLYFGIGSATDAEAVGLTQFGTQLARVAVAGFGIAGGVASGSAYILPTDAARTIRQVGIFSDAAGATLLLYQLLDAADYVTLGAGIGRSYDMSEFFNSAVTEG